jgi:parallel beta-helix repeat protein
MKQHLIFGILLAIGNWAPVNSGAASVREFGAAGDGKTDDTAAIEKALAESKEGRLIFPRGDYRISRTIEIHLAERGFTSLSGDGGVGRVTMAGEGPAFRFIGTHTGTASPASVRPQVWQKERMPQIEGLEITGDHPEADGLEFIEVMQPTVRAVLIRDVRHGIRLTRRNRNLLIDASHIYNCSGIGIFFDRVNLHQANIQGSHISYCKGGGIKIVGGEIRNLQITGNDIEYNYDLDAAQSADVWFDLRDGGSIAEGTIVSNTIQARPSPGGANIRFLGPEKPEERTRMGLWSITGNLIGSQTVNVHLKNSRGIVVTGNHIYSGQERTLVLEKSRHIVVGPNSLDQSHNFGRGFKNGVTVRDCDGVILNGLILDASQAGSEEEGGAIEIFDSRETTITGCQIFEPKFRGIYVSGSRNTLIADCMILDRTGKSPPLAAIEVDDTSLGAVIRGNIVERGE